GRSLSGEVDFGCRSFVYSGKCASLSQRADVTNNLPALQIAIIYRFDSGLDPTFYMQVCLALRRFFNARNLGGFYSRVCV
uniref:Uncharacterized protein n=1 Tax=Aegilops tauschii subsp. strangulata TaxID=200361 RepID=A0A453MY84_AEGTS